MPAHDVERIHQAASHLPALRGGERAPTPSRKLARAVSTEAFEVRAVEGTGSERRLHVQVPLGSRFFEGHFDGMPMLPGVASVVAIAHREASRTLGPLGAPRRMTRVKFTEAILPGDRLVVSLAREHEEAEVRVRFRIERIVSDAPRMASSGTLIYASTVGSSA